MLNMNNTIYNHCREYKPNNLNDYIDAVIMQNNNKKIVQE